MSISSELNMFESLNEMQVVEQVEQQVFGLTDEEEEVRVILDTRPEPLDNVEFPTLGDQPQDKTPSMKLKGKKGKTVHTEFTVASSRISELSEDRYRKAHPAQSSYTRKTYDPQDLVCTRPCSFVSEPTAKDVEFGVCYRETCSYAHSMEEYKRKPCLFGDKCRHNDCVFFHAGSESPEQFDDRVGKPHLPPTSVKSRQPKPGKTAPRVSAPRVSAPRPQKTFTPFIHQSSWKAVKTPVFEQAPVSAFAPIPVSPCQITPAEPTNPNKVVLKVTVAQFVSIQSTIKSLTDQGIFVEVSFLEC